MNIKELETQKKVLNTLKNKFGISTLSASLILSLVACNNNENNNYNITTTQAITEYNTEELIEYNTEELSEYTTEELTEYTTEELTEYEDTQYNELSNDEIIIDEFNNYKEDIKQLIENDQIQTVKEKGREYFIKTVDFIFFDSEINGITFNELKDDSKKELFTELCEMDEIISSVAPDYKDNISEKYTLVKDYTKKTYYSSLDKIKEYIGEKKYDQVTQFKDKSKESVNEFIDNHQDDINNAKETIDEKSEEYKLKLKNWYEKYKEE